MSPPLIRNIHITMMAMGAAQGLVDFFKGNPPLLRPHLFGKFRLAFIAEPTITVWRYPEFHFYLLFLRFYLSVDERFFP